MKTFEQFLQDFFIELREFNEKPIIKDNFEDLFDQWLEEKDVNDIMKLAELWGREQRVVAKKEVLNAFKGDNIISIEELKANRI